MLDMTIPFNCKFEIISRKYQLSQPIFSKNIPNITIKVEKN